MSSGKEDVLQRFDILDKHMVELYAKWVFAKGVFGHAATLSGMNVISPIGFGLIQRSLYTDMIASVCAASDPPRQGKFDNLTVLRLVDEATAFSSATQIANLQNLRDKLEAMMEPVRAHRNKWIGHFDLETLTAQEPSRVQIGEIEAALHGLAQTMSAVSVVLRNGMSVAYLLTSPGNAVGEFQWLISDALRFRMLRDLAENSKVTPDVLVRMVANRSDRHDPPNLNKPYREDDDHSE